SRAADGHRHRRRARRDLAVDGVETQSVQAARSQVVVSGRYDQRRNRSRVHDGDAAAARSRDGNACNTWQTDQAPPRPRDSQRANRRNQRAPAGGVALREGERPRSLVVRDRRDVRCHECAVRYGTRRIRRRPVPNGRQERHGTGLHRCRERAHAQSGRARRAPARSRVVRRLRARRGSEARGRRHHRKRTGRRIRIRGTRRASDPRCLPPHARAAGRTGSKAQAGTARASATYDRMNYDALETSRAQRTLTGSARLLLALHLDGPLFVGLCLVGAVGTIVMFSASGQSLGHLEAQLLRFALGLIAMIALAQVPPRMIRTATPWAYLLGLVLLLLVAATGDIAMGAQRWLDLGFIRFQPSEMMKLAVPL